jgi:hypothetical protein
VVDETAGCLGDQDGALRLATLAGAKYAADVAIVVTAAKPQDQQGIVDAVSYRWRTLLREVCEGFRARGTGADDIESFRHTATAAFNGRISQILTGDAAGHA